MKLFFIEGHYIDPEDGGMTTDYILAKDGYAAADEATRAREGGCSNGWELDHVNTFEDYISETERVIRNMKTLSDDEIRKGWEDTKRNLGGESCPDEDEGENDDE